MITTFSFGGFAYQPIESALGDSGFGRIEMLTLAVCNHVTVYDRQGFFEINPRAETRWAIFRANGDIQQANFKSLEDAKSEMDARVPKFA